MKVTKLIKVMIIVFLVLAAVAISSQFLSARANQNLYSSIHEQRNLTAAVNELHLASTELVSWSRAFAAAGGYRHYRFYQDEINYYDRIGASYAAFIASSQEPDEIYLLNIAMSYSARLRESEMQAISARLAGDYQLASQLLFTDEHTYLILAFNDTLDMLYNISTDRSTELVIEFYEQAAFHNTVSILMVLIYVIISISGAVIILKTVASTIKREQKANEEARSANEMNRIFLEYAPFAIGLWDEDLNLIDCNPQSFKMMGLESKEAYAASFDELSPEVQPDGRRSAEASRMLRLGGFEKGYTRFEWMHKTINGDPLPVEIVIVPVTISGKKMLLSYKTDLSQVRAAHEKEMEAHKLAQFYLDSSPMFIEIYNEDMELIDCNEKTVDFFGINSKEEFLGGFHSFFPELQPDGTPSDEKLREILSAALRDGISRSEWLFIKPDGNHMLAECTIVRLNLGDKLILASYNHDLTEINAAREKEKEAHQLAQLYMDRSPMFIEMWNEKMELIDCNERVVEFFGLNSKDEYLEQYDNLSPEIQPDGSVSRIKSRELIETALKEGFSRSEWLHTRTDGEHLSVECNVVRVKRGDEFILITYNIDITGLKNAARKIDEAESRAALLLEAMPLSCCLLDGKYNIIDCNRATLKLFVGLPSSSYENPYNSDDLSAAEYCSLDCANCDESNRGKCYAKKFFAENFLSVFLGGNTPSDTVDQVVSKLCDTALENGIAQAEISILSIVDNEQVPCEVTVVPIERGDETCFALYMRDVRETRLMMEEMQKREVAERESKSKTRFLARMSHEIRTPMNAVIGITDILLKREHPTETQEALMRIRASSSLLLAVINDILDLSKIEADKMEVLPVKYSAASLISDTTQLNMMYIGSKHIDFELKVDDNIPANLIGDELRIKQILNNLISNAFKYTNEGTVTLTFGVENDGGQTILVFNVVDSGQGMTKEQVDNLFELEFTRFNAKANRMIEGTGLGLSISHSLITMMDGSITVESELGKGSRFTVKIPQDFSGDEVLGAEVVDSLQSFRLVQKKFEDIDQLDFEPMPYGKVLVVDDVETNLYVMEGILEPYKIEIETADSGRKAVEKIVRGKVYDIIFMDHMMPDMDGIEATNAIRRMGYTQPIVALTANAVSGSAGLFMQNGFTGFVSKPVNVDLLETYLFKYIRDRQSPEVIKQARSLASKPDDSEQT